MQNRCNKTRAAKLYRHIAPLVGALLLSLSVPAYADQVQDAHKLFKQGQQSQALEKVNGVLAGKPKDAQARFLKGLILTEQGNTAEAVKIFSALTEDFPELPEPYNNLAVLYAGQGQYDKARYALEMAIRTHPSYATAHENLGDIYAKMASQAYDRALQLDRGNAATQTKLAMIQDLFSGSQSSKPTIAVVAAKPVETPVPVVIAKPVETKVAVAAPVAVVKPVEAEAKPVVKPDANNNEVLKAVNAWAAAWSAQNTKKYLSFYAPDFKTPGGESRAKWEASRKDRVSAPKFIEVNISKPSVSFSDATHATVQFHQSYRASNFKSSSSKTLSMVKSGGNWLIQEERSR